MKDDFEKHIKEHKGVFDEHIADKAKIWAEIELKLDTPKRKVIPLWSRNFLLLKVAASFFIGIAFLSIVGLIVFNESNYNQTNTMVNLELNEIDMHYKGLVSHQVQLVINNTVLSADEKKEFLSFIDELDEEYEVLRSEMERNLDNERVLEAIVSNYKKRIELIENLLKQINKRKKTNDNDEYVL